MTHLAMLAALTAAAKGEAIFRPSSAARLIGCPGSIQLQARSPYTERSSIYAMLGTAAHHVAQQALLSIKEPDQWTYEEFSTLAGYKVSDTEFEEMPERLQVYLDTVAAAWKPGVEMHVEYPLRLGSADPADPVFAQNRGTGDCVMVNTASGEIEIIDLKWGVGHAVPGDAPQLKNYALMALVNFTPAGRWAKVTTTVVQPRLTAETDWVKPVPHDPAVLLSDFLGQLAAAMYAALAPDPPLNPGPWCQWCKAAANCPALQHAAMHIARDPLSIMPAFDTRSMLALPTQVFVGTVEQPYPMTTMDNGVVLPPATVYSASDIADILDREVLWDTWIAAIKHRAAILALSGVTIPGHELKARSGNRRWRYSVAETVDRLRVIGVKMTDMFAPDKLRSPHQIEVTLPKESQALIEPLVERPEGTPELVKSGRKKSTPSVTPLMGPFTPA